MIKPSTRYVAVCNYVEIFGDTLPDDKLEFIQGYPTDLLVVKLTRINAILFQELNIPRQTTRSLEVLFPRNRPHTIVDHQGFGDKRLFCLGVDQSFNEGLHGKFRCIGR